MTRNDPAPGLGEQVRRRREELNLTQTELGAVAGVHRATIRALELGRSVEPRTLTNVLRSLGCRPSPDYGPDPVSPVFTAGSTAIVVHSLLSGLDLDDNSKHHRVPGDLVADWYELVDAAARGHNAARPDLPATFERLHAGLPMTERQRRLLRDEVSQLLGEPEPPAEVDPEPQATLSPPTPEVTPATSSASTTAALLAIAEAIDRLTAALIHCNTDRRRV